MIGKEMRAKLHQGERVYGTMANAVSPRWPGVLSDLGLDFVFIDTEHSAQDRTQVAWMCQLYAAQGVVPVVRIPSPDPYQACMVLDGGSQGVIAPYIETPDQVRELVGAVKYRPLKGARLYNRLSGQEKLEPELETYLNRRNENNLLIVNIESRPAMNALDDILAVDGLDGVLIGPHDLSCNLGIPEQYFHPIHVQAVDEIIQKARACNIGAGIHVFYPDALEQEVRWVKLGANIIVHGVDSGILRTYMQRDLDRLKTLLDDQGGEP